MSDTTTGKTVRFTLDPANPPKLNDEAKARLAHLAAMPDREIDFSDIPPSPADAEWTRPGIPFSTENKRQVTLRLDADVLDYFRRTGTRYQTRINQVLRAYMQAHIDKR
ncbi:MAG: BrnA antitoxin family protein [Fulvimonas sp.]|nr:BrnA antitoxin family protein [Fulvimonas sp.]